MLGNAHAQDQIDELKSIADGSQFLFRIPRVHFTKKERQLAALLMKRSHVHREVAFTVLYSGKHVDERPDERVIDTVVHNVKKKLLTVEVEVKRDEAGWFIDATDKKRLRDLEIKEATKPIKVEVRKYRIEKDVPIPAAFHGRDTPYPFAEMAPGDSFFCDLDIKRVRAATHTYKRKVPDVKFVVRAMDGGVRVWRIE